MLYLLVCVFFSWSPVVCVVGGRLVFFLFFLHFFLFPTGKTATACPSVLVSLLEQELHSPTRPLTPSFLFHAHTHLVCCLFTPPFPHDVCRLLSLKKCFSLEFCCCSPPNLSSALPSVRVDSPDVFFSICARQSFSLFLASGLFLPKVFCTVQVVGEKEEFIPSPPLITGFSFSPFQEVKLLLGPETPSV